MKASKRAMFRGEAIAEEKTLFIRDAQFRKDYRAGLYAVELYRGKLDNPEGMKCKLSNGDMHFVYAEVAAWINDQDIAMGVKDPTGQNVVPNMSKAEWLGDVVPEVIEESLVEKKPAKKSVKDEIGYVEPLPEGKPTKRPLTKQVKDMLQRGLTKE